MEQFEWLIAKILFPMLISWLFFKLVEYLTNKISIRDYEFEGDDLVNAKTKVIWYYADNNKNGIKYSNNKYYFKVFTQFFKGEEGKMVTLVLNKPINTEDKSTFDFSTIVIFNKKEMNFKIRIKLIKWLIGECIKNKFCSCREKKYLNF